MLLTQDGEDYVAVGEMVFQKGQNRWYLRLPGSSQWRRVEPEVTRMDFSLEAPC